MDESYAVFEADDNGNIDLSRQAPVEGCYSGINSMYYGIVCLQNLTIKI